MDILPKLYSSCRKWTTRAEDWLWNNEQARRLSHEPCEAWPACDNLHRNDSAGTTKYGIYKSEQSDSMKNYKVTAWKITKYGIYKSEQTGLRKASPVLLLCPAH